MSRSGAWEGLSRPWEGEHPRPRAAGRPHRGDVRGSGAKADGGSVPLGLSSDLPPPLLPILQMGRLRKNLPKGLTARERGSQALQPQRMDHSKLWTPLSGTAVI